MVSKIRIPGLVRVNDESLQRYLDALRQAVIELSQVPFIQGVKLSQISLTSSVSKLEHKLGVPYTGAFALNGTSITLDTANPNPEREIWVSLPSGTTTTDLWVY